MIPSALVEKGKITPFFYAQAFVSGDQHPANALETWSVAKLASVGVYPLIPAPAVLPYHIAGTPTYTLKPGTMIQSKKVVESRTDKPMSLADAKAQKQAEIDMDFEVAVQQLLAGYPESESRTFWKQEKEAYEYPAKPAPFLTKLALTRGVPLLTLIAKVKANTPVLEDPYAILLGTKQKRSDMLAIATTLTDVINV